MKRYLLEREVVVRKPLAEVFEFFSRPENLAQITPPWLGFRILTPVPIPMKEGALIDYTVKVFGVRIRWKTQISEYGPPRRFVDEQLRGPYALWRHTHTFSEVDGGTGIRDEVEYAMPFGVIGRIARRLIVRRQLDAIFAHRANVIERHFQGEKP
jgi:ligand-binding SRPBCC domain-containing protein